MGVTDDELQRLIALHQPVQDRNMLGHLLPSRRCQSCGAIADEDPDWACTTRSMATELLGYRQRG